MTVLERHARAEEAKMLARDVCEAATATLEACGEVRCGSRLRRATPTRIGLES